MNKLNEYIEQEKKSINHEKAKLESKEYSTFEYVKKQNSKKVDEALQSVTGKKTNQGINQKNILKDSFPALLDKVLIPIQLPSVGILYVYQNKRYLAITDWNEYERGLAEAIRLQAELVAERSDTDERK